MNTALKPLITPFILLLICFTGCRTPLPDSPVQTTTHPPTTGYYIMDAPFFYSGLTHLSKTTPNLYTLYLLEKRGGNFALKKGRRGRYKIVKDHVSFDKIKRSLHGQAELGSDGIFRGFALTRIKNMGLISRDHRKGEFTLRRASSKEAQARKRKITHPPPNTPLP